MKTHKLAILLALGLMLGALMLVGVVGAANSGSSYFVDSTADATDKNLGDNSCATAANVCTLRAAIMEANAHPGTDTITLKHLAAGSTPDVFKLTIGGKDDETPDAAIGDLDVTESVNISGFNAAWTVIDGNGKDRIFDLHGGTYVDLTSMTIQNGDTGFNHDGGGVRARGVSASLRFVVLDNNKGGVGGGIFNGGGQMSLTRVVIKNNQIYATVGGGLYNEGGLKIEQSTFNNNKAYRGGGLYNAGQTLIANSTFSANRADGEGGGIANENNLGKFVDLSNVTIAYNVADDDTSGTGIAGGVYNEGSGIVSVRNSIIALNIDKTSTDDDDCFGTFLSDGYNLIGHNWQCVGFTATGDQTGGPNAYLDPKLEPLAKNGGFAPSHALKTGSPAIDAGDYHGCNDKYGQLLSYDQRAYQRHVDGDNNASPWCDIGAYEVGSHYITPTPTPPVVDCSQKPEAATLDTPANQSETTKRKVALDWTGKVCTTKYKILVRQDAKNGPKIVKKTQQTTEYTTPKLAKNHTYFWRVFSCNDVGCKKSGWFSFTVVK